MSLAFSIFLLVFVAELIQWIGQSVILELVSIRALKVTRVLCMLLGIRHLLAYLLWYTDV